MRDELERDGFVVVRGVLDRAQVEAFIAALAPATAGVRSRHGTPFAARHALWEAPALPGLLATCGIDRLASQALGAGAFAIDATLLDKNPAANWKVPRHQDLSLPVANRADVPGFRNWTTRVGVDHVEPPADVLARLVALRIHLDDTPVDNGALALARGSHARGKLDDAAIDALAADELVVCPAARGDVLVMKPLVVHRSSPARVAASRRVLHVVYAADEPAPDLRWKRA